MKKGTLPPAGGEGGNSSAQGQAFDGLPTPKNIAEWAISEPAFMPAGAWGIVRLMLSRAKRQAPERQVNVAKADTPPLLGGEADAAIAEITNRRGDGLVAILASLHSAPVLAISTKVDGTFVHLMFEVGEDFLWKSASPHWDVKEEMLMAWFAMQTTADHFLKNMGK